MDERRTMPWRPQICVWELTLACNLRCRHCGSNAGQSRAAELSTEECLDVAAQLGAAGCALATLSGGEPTLRSDWDAIAVALRAAGTVPNMVTNGCYRDRAHAREIAQRARQAGLANVGVSIDGPREVHDEIRGEGSFDRSMVGLEAFREEGVELALLTCVHKLNLHTLEAMWALARSLGAAQWRVQLAKPMGALDQQRELVLGPADFVQLIERVSELKRRPGLHVGVGDSIGYFGPHEATLRARGQRHTSVSWQGCQAGLQVIGIEANGNVKGCLSMQAFQGDDDRFVEGNLREHSLAAIWARPGAFAYNRAFRLESLSGACRDCGQAERCRGGARCVASALTGDVRHDPLCWTAIRESSASARPRDPLVHGAAALAASALLSLGASACKSTPPVPSNDGAIEQHDVSSPLDVSESPYEPSPDRAAEYGVPVPAYGVYPLPDPQPQLEYGIEPAPPPPIEPAYAVLPAPEPMPEYGVRIAPPPPPVDCATLDCSGARPDAVSPADWSNCCAVPEYGVRVAPPPAPDIQAEYMAPLPREQGCPECEYGVNLRPEPAAQPEYGVEVPPERTP